LILGENGKKREEGWTRKKCFKSKLHVFVNIPFRKTALKFTVLILLHATLSLSSVELTLYTEIFN